jgi:Uma2 family endonuclease
MANASSPSSIPQSWTGGFPAPGISSLPYRLEPGEQLDQKTFHERYKASPPGLRAELIQGTVVLPSPVLPEHGYGQFFLIHWFATYHFSTPGVAAYDNVTLLLSPTTEVQPDIMMLIEPEFGGQIRLEEGYFVGGPELVAEVAYSSQSYDMHTKRAAYEEAGVREYVVFMLRERQVAWFVLRDGKFAPHMTEQGVFRSICFPGLWLNETALLAGDMAGVLSTLQQGMAHADHAAFVERLASQRRS